MSARPGPRSEDLAVLLPRLEAHRTTRPGPAYKLAAFNAVWTFHGFNDPEGGAIRVAAAFDRIKHLEPPLREIGLQELVETALSWLETDLGVRN